MVENFKTSLESRRIITSCNLHLQVFLNSRQATSSRYVQNTHHRILANANINVEHTYATERLSTG